MHIIGVSSLAAAFNFITTIINMRAPGMNLMRMPMFTWNAFVVQFLLAPLQFGQFARRDGVDVLRGDAHQARHDVVFGRTFGIVAALGG